MEDKEIGKLWKIYTTEPCDVRDLIRKLVEERISGRYDDKFPRAIGLKRALADFGIDPETWTNE